MKLNPQFSTDRAAAAPAADAMEIQIRQRPTDLFQPGTVLVSAAAQEKICPVCIGLALKSHALGQWGRLSAWDKMANDNALKDGGRILSKFRGGAGVEFYICTAADRSTTTICLVEEF